MTSAQRDLLTEKDAIQDAIAEGRMTSGEAELAFALVQERFNRLEQRRLRRNRSSRTYREVLYDLNGHHGPA